MSEKIAEIVEKIKALTLVEAAECNLSWCWRQKNQRY